MDRADRPTLTIRKDPHSNLYFSSRVRRGVNWRRKLQVHYATLCRKTFPRKVRGTADPSAAPDFLLSPMGSAKLMRLSLMKAANEVIFGAA